MGLTSYEKMRAEQLASLGYMAFAADIYGKGIRPQNPQDASAQAGIYYKDRQLLRARINAALDILKNNKFVNPAKIAAIGYCFGGGTVLELARSGADIAGAISFHGTLDTPNPAEARNIKCKILILHGANDPYSNAEKIAGFEDEMNKANVDWQLVLYSGAVHSFTIPTAGNDPSTGSAYNEKADKRSWEAMKQFFAEIFR
jgi:dienelactone hydrolase